MREQMFQLTEQQMQEAVAQYLLRKNRIIGLPPCGWFRAQLWRDRDMFVVRVTDPLTPEHKDN